jgi:hypothetical protein
MELLVASMPIHLETPCTAFLNGTDCEECMTAAEVTDKCSRVEEYWFPGRWVGGVSMVLAPIILLAGVLLRIEFHFFFRNNWQHSKIIRL